MDPHCQEILQEYRDNLPLLNKTADDIRASIKKALDDAGLIIVALECRVKTEHSLAGKLELKGSKYASLGDITDIIGLRIITFYIDDVDKVASAVERLFTVDWENSVDKRKIHDIDSFGYLSLHYICKTTGCPYRFEIQMRTVLQHAWANMNHDTGYKSGVEIPTRYRRDMSRIAGMLELIDDEFSRIRTEINDYRRRVQALVASGNLADVALDGDSFRSFLAIEPFKNLNRKIAAVNQAEIQDVSLLQFLPVFKGMGFKSLGVIENLIKQYSEAAYQIATFQIGLTDIDIVSSSIGPQDLCIAYIIKNGWGKAGLKLMLESLNGPSESNESMAEYLEEETKGLPFMNQ